MARARFSHAVAKWPTGPELDRRETGEASLGLISGQMCDTGRGGARRPLDWRLQTADRGWIIGELSLCLVCRAGSAFLFPVQRGESMNLPGFDAEAALRRTAYQHRPSLAPGTANNTSNAIFPAYWLHYKLTYGDERYPQHHEAGFGGGRARAPSWRGRRGGGGNPDCFRNCQLGCGPNRGRRGTRGASAVAAIAVDPWPRARPQKRADSAVGRDPRHRRLPGVISGPQPAGNRILLTGIREGGAWRSKVADRYSPMGQHRGTGHVVGGRETVSLGYASGQIRSAQLTSGSSSRMRGLRHQRPAQASAPITAGNRNHGSPTRTWVATAPPR